MNECRRPGAVLAHLKKIARERKAETLRKGQANIKETRGRKQGNCEKTTALRQSTKRPNIAEQKTKKKKNTLQKT